MANAFERRLHMRSDEAEPLEGALYEGFTKHALALVDEQLMPRIDSLLRENGVVIEQQSSVSGERVTELIREGALIAAELALIDQEEHDEGVRKW